MVVEYTTRSQVVLKKDDSLIKDEGPPHTTALLHSSGDIIFIEKDLSILVQYFIP